MARRRHGPRPQRRDAPAPRRGPTGGRITVEQLDVTEPHQLPPLHDRLANRLPSGLDVLFVNAGMTSNEETAICDVPTADFVADADRALLLMAPGWIKTALGGDDAPFTIADNVPKIVDVMLAKRRVPGLQYLDFRGDTVPW